MLATLRGEEFRLASGFVEYLIERSKTESRSGSAMVGELLRHLHLCNGLTVMQRVVQSRRAP